MGAPILPTLLFLPAKCRPGAGGLGSGCPAWCLTFRRSRSNLETCCIRTTSSGRVRKSRNRFTYVTSTTVLCIWIIFHRCPLSGVPERAGFLHRMCHSECHCCCSKWLCAKTMALLGDPVLAICSFRWASSLARGKKWQFLD